MPATLTVRVLCFSHVRAVLGRDVLELTLPAGSTAGDVVQRVVAEGGDRLAGLPMKIAVNERFADPSEAVADGDEIALIPPVQGGAPARVRVRITPDALPAYEPEVARPDAGAELVFHGRVRAIEAEQDIVALHYEAYAGMALRELEALAETCVARFSLLDLSCVHRVGDVPVGEPSLRVVVRSRHRGEGIEALDWFIRELKERVPIWKWGVTAAGDRFPTSGPEAPGSR